MAIADSMTRGLSGRVFVLRGGEGAVSPVLVELLGGGFDSLSQFGVLANELRDVIGVEPEDVLDDQHLGVAVRPGTDADGGNGQRFRYALAERAGDAFEHDGKGAGLLERFCVFEDLLGGLIATSLDSITADLVDKG